MVGGDVMTRENFVQTLRELEVSQENIDSWVKDRRGPETVQICIICEGFMRFLWFSIREPALSNLWNNPVVSKVLAEDWQDRLTETIATGDRELSTYSRELI